MFRFSLICCMILLLSSVLTGCAEEKTTYPQLSSKGKLNNSVSVSDVPVVTHSATRVETTTPSIASQTNLVDYLTTFSFPFNMRFHAHILLEDNSHLTGTRISVFHRETKSDEMEEITEVAKTTIGNLDQFEFPGFQYKRYRIELHSSNGAAMGFNFEPYQASENKKLQPAPAANNTSQFDFQWKVPIAQSLSGKIIDNLGNPITSATIYYRTSQPVTIPPNTLYPLEQQSNVSPDGTFQFTHVTAGESDILVVSDGYKPLLTEKINAPTSVPLILKLEKGGGITTGFVNRLDTGAPVPNARVTAIIKAKEVANPLLVNFAKHLHCTTDDHGHYTLSNIPTLPFRLTAETVDPLLREPHWLRKSAPAITLNDNQSTNVNILIYPGHSIKGLVYDKETNEPLSNAFLYANDNKLKIQSDPSGFYEFQGIFLDTDINVSYKDYTPYESQNYVSLEHDEISITKDIAMVRQIQFQGTTLTPDGQPLPFATVNYGELYFDTGKGNELISDKKGFFQFQTKPFTTVGISASHPQYATSLGDKISIGINDILDYKIILKKPVSVSYYITDENENPISDVSAAIMSKIDDDYISMSHSLSEANSDSHGIISFRNIPSQYELVLSKIGYETINRSEIFQVDNPPKDAMPISLKKIDAISGNIRTTSGVPLLNSIKIVANDIDKSYEAEFDGQGNFTIPTTKGIYSITSSEYPEFVNLSDTPSGTAQLSLIINPKSKADSVAPKSILNLTGHVIDSETHTPVSDFKVVSNQFLIKKDKTIPGKFNINSAVSPGSYTITISSHGYLTKDYTIDFQQSRETSQTFALETGSGVRGQVIEKKTHKPIEGALIKSVPANPRRNNENYPPDSYTVTDSDGQFLMTKIPSGQTTINVTPPPPFLSVEKPIFVINGKENNIDKINVSAGKSLNITVLDTVDKPVQNMLLELTYPLGGTEIKSNGFTDSEGKFLFEGLPSDNIKLIITKHNINRNYDFDENQDSLDTTIHLGGTRFVGEIDSHSSPLYAEISLTLLPEGQTYKTTTKSNKFIIENVVPGDYQIQLKSITYQSGSFSLLNETFTVPNDKEFEKTFTLNTGRISGKVQNSNGAPVPGSSIYLSSNDPSLSNSPSTATEIGMITTDNNGEYEFPFLPSAVYEITATHPKFGIAAAEHISVVHNKTEKNFRLGADAGSIEVSAIDKQTGHFINDYSFAIETVPGYLTSFSSKNFNISEGILVVSNMESGEYNYKILPQSGYLPFIPKEKITVKRNHKSEITCQLIPAGRLNLEVKQKDGSSVSNYKVILEKRKPEIDEKPKQFNVASSKFSELVEATDYYITIKIDGQVDTLYRESVPFNESISKRIDLKYP